MKLILSTQLLRDQFYPSKLNFRLIHHFGFHLVFRRFSKFAGEYLTHYVYIFAFFFFFFFFRFVYTYLETLNQFLLVIANASAEFGDIFDNISVYLESTVFCFSSIVTLFK